MNQNRLEKPSRREWALRFALDAIPGLGFRTQKRLYDTFGTAVDVAKAFEKREVGNLGLSTAKRNVILEGLGLQDEGLFESRNHSPAFPDSSFSVVGYPDATYPRLLKEISDPPPFFWFTGDFSAFQQPCVSIVGTRRASAYGRRSAHRLAFELASQGITIVSGMAFGIDRAAHEGALDAGGKTIAVLGGGLRHIYPKAHKTLAKEITDAGCLMSEFKPDELPIKTHFPRRNRIISGLSSCTIVVEAFEKAGALVTARMCIEQQRDLFCVPGRIDEETSSGTNKLLAQSDGALLYSSKQILEHLEQLGLKKPLSTSEKVGQSRELPLKPDPSATPQSALERKIIAVLQSGAQSMDSLNAKLEFPGAALWSALLFLECDGTIRQTPLGDYEMVRPSP